MNNTVSINLKGVQETLVLPLWARAAETQKPYPLLVDNEAVRIINSLDYDFNRFEQQLSSLSFSSWIARSLYFDKKACEFLKTHPNGSIINLGCGLDTTYERIQKGKETWYELDFPRVIEVKKQIIQPCSNRKLLPCTVLDNSWYSRIANKDEVFIIAGGLIYFFEEHEVKKLFESFRANFSKCTMVFDFCSQTGMKIANKKVIQNSGINNDAMLKWGINNLKSFEDWGMGIQINDCVAMFKDYRKKVPLKKRPGMWLSDLFSFMSLASISICSSHIVRAMEI